MHNNYFGEEADIFWIARSKISQWNRCRRQLKRSAKTLQIRTFYFMMGKTLVSTDARATAIEFLVCFKLYFIHEPISLHHDCYCLFVNRVPLLGVCDLLLRLQLQLQIKRRFIVLSIVRLLLWILAVVRVFMLLIDNW